MISVLLIGYLLATANLGELFATLKSWNASYFLIAVLLGVVRNVVFAYRWRTTLVVNRIQIPFLTLVKFYFVGAFFNLFLPTALGGDVVRGYDLAVYSGNRMGAVASVLVERIIGFFALASIALLALLLGGSEINNTTVTTIILIACLGYFASTIILLNAKFVKRFIGILKFVRLWNIGERVDRLYDSLQAFTAHKTLLFRCFALSIVCQTLAILAAYSLALAVKLELPLIYFFMLLPMIWIITMVPLSINGLGLREGAFVFFFTRVGVSSSAALLLSFLNLSQIAVLGLIGGTTYLFDQVFPSMAIQRAGER